MPKNMLIHDTRVAGGTPTSLAQNNFIVNATTSTAHIFEWAEYYARTQKGLDNLYIICHGNSAYLELGDKGVSLNTSYLFTIFAGDVSRIIIMACLVASGQNGPIFCSRAAQQAQAIIVASDAEQAYSYWQWSKFGLKDSEMNDGSWEGRVFQFNPNGTYFDNTANPPSISNYF